MDKVGDPLRVPDAELSFGPELVMHYQGLASTGVSYEVMEDGRRSAPQRASRPRHGWSSALQTFGAS